MADQKIYQLNEKTVVVNNTNKNNKKQSNNKSKNR